MGVATMQVHFVFVEINASAFDFVFQRYLLDFFTYVSASYLS